MEEACGEIVHVTFDGEGYKNLNTIDVDRTN